MPSTTLRLNTEVSPVCGLGKDAYRSGLHTDPFQGIENRDIFSMASHQHVWRRWSPCQRPVNRDWTTPLQLGSLCNLHCLVRSLRSTPSRSIMNSLPSSHKRQGTRLLMLTASPTHMYGRPSMSTTAPTPCYGGPQMSSAIASVPRYVQPAQLRMDGGRDAGISSNPKGSSARGDSSSRQAGNAINQPTPLSLRPAVRLDRMICTMTVRLIGNHFL